MRNVNLTTFYNPQKPLIYNGFRYIFYKKFNFLKCRKKKPQFFEFYKSPTTLDFTRVTGTMHVFLIMYSK